MSTPTPTPELDDRITVLYRRYHQLVIGYITDRLGGDRALAEDLAQMTWRQAIAVTGVDEDAVEAAETIGARLGMGPVIVR